MADPHYRSALGAATTALTGVTITDESVVPKWRVWDDVGNVSIGHCRKQGEELVLCIAPGEWMVLGDRPRDVEAVDITHVRAALRITGDRARRVLQGVCALDFSDLMTPNGAAARTTVAGVATELVRDDVDGVRSYLLLMSRSFARSVHHRLVAAAS